MQTTHDFREINETKVNFDSLYSQKDPRDYFKFLGQLDYIIPHLAQPIFAQLIRARQELQAEPVTVLDLGCSYGVNGALTKYALDYDSLLRRYTAPALNGLTSAELLALDRAYYQAWPRRAGIRVIGLDVSENAVRYAEAVGTLDRGIAIDLEQEEPQPEDAAALGTVDLIISTGCVGYVGARTFARLARLARHGRPAWVASFVLRMFPYDAIATTLAQSGLVTERFEGATFVQRRFATVTEMEETVRAVEARGLDTSGREAEGLFHADLYVSRPQDEIGRSPLQRMVTVVSGANKPWTLGKNVLGTFGEAARKRARAARPRLTAARGP
jgi:SAM-dependent methyltransferase